MRIPSASMAWPRYIGEFVSKSVQRSSKSWLLVEFGVIEGSRVLPGLGFFRTTSKYNSLQSSRADLRTYRLPTCQHGRFGCLDVWMQIMREFGGKVSVVG